MDSWLLLHSDKEVEVYRQSSSTNRYGEFRSVTEVDQNLNKTYQVFRDFSAYDKWFGFCIESYQVAEHSHFHKTAFFGINAPWPVKDKYMVLEVYFDYNGKDKTGNIVFSLSRNEYGINPESYDPMRIVEGYCVLEEIEENRTQVVFTFINDPGGKIPRAIFQKFLQEQMIQTARGLRRYAPEK